MRDADQIQERDAGRFQVAGLTLAGIAVLAAVFGLGFTVGKRVARLERPQQEVLDPLAQLHAERKAYDKLTFYQQLTAGQAAAPQAKPGANKPANAEKMAGPNPEPPVAAVKAVPSPEPVAAPAVRVPVAATPSPSPMASTGSGEATILSAMSSGPARTGDFTVQVSSFQTKAEAHAFSAALERKGFRPFVVEALLANKGTWYRVRLGRFDNEDQARLAKGLLARSDIPAWVLRSE